MKGINTRQKKTIDSSENKRSKDIPPGKLCLSDNSQAEMTIFKHL